MILPTMMPPNFFPSRKEMVGVLFLLALILQQVSSQVLGGELMAFNTEALQQNVTHRQDICYRYEDFRNGEVELRYALEGLELRPVLMDVAGDFFHYDDETGIDPTDPGLLAVILDEVALRGKFSWRQSFDLMTPPWNAENWTFTDLLVWSVDTYDIAIGRWDLSVERMDRGVAYTTPWFDGSVVLIAQEEVPEKEIYLFGLFRPFTTGVWILTWVTVLVSGIIHQILEYWNDERHDRSLWQWFRDSHYLSILNATQNYEYAPNCASGRIFGVSMAMWSLVMTATYTANLASLLVEKRGTEVLVDSMEKAALLGVPVCTYANTNADIVIQTDYEDVIRVPRATELETYESLQRGECGLVAGLLDSWLGYQVDSRYNPDCDLTWVGREVEIIKSGFATKADVGNYCTSFIRDVFNVHLTEMSGDGFLAEAWANYRARAAAEHPSECFGDGTDGEDINSGLFSTRALRRQQQDNAAARTRRALRTSTPRLRTVESGSSRTSRRKLKGGGGNAAASSSGGDGSTQSLSLAQMSGAFVLHYCLMVTALLFSGADRYYSRFRPQKQPNDSTDNIEQDKRTQFASNKQYLVSYRPNGPIIGTPPPVNTFHRSSTQFGTDGGNTVEEGSTSEEDGLGETQTTGSTSLPGETNPVLQSLQTGMRASQSKLRVMQRDTSQVKSQQQELANKVDMMMGMLQELYSQQKTGSDVTGAFLGNETALHNHEHVE